MDAISWSQEERGLLDAILSELIPANPERGIPSAGEAGVADSLAQSAAQSPEREAAFRAVVSRAAGLAGGVSADGVREIEAALPEAFGILLAETYKGYYSRPDMRAHVGVGAHPVHPDGYEVEAESEELLAELTAPVRGRGACYRDPTRSEGGGNGQ